MTIHVLNIFGTRPEAVKMAPVVLQLAATAGVESRVCVTAQHRQMLDQVLSVFKIVPDIDLNLMRPDQSLADLTAGILTHLDPVLKSEKPDWVLVQGDTTTVMTTALLCYYNRIRVGHVEAGLRTDDKWQPFPEEINRRIAGVVADLHFTPTQHARRNLLREGVPDERIVVTGNPVIDALQKIVTHPMPTETQELLRGLAEQYSDSIHLIYPVHLNPNVQQPVYQLLAGVPNITLLPPLDYLPMVHLMKRATLVLTDSGGIQEEATGLGVPTLVLREVTERPEGLEAGVLKLVGSDPARIVRESARLLDDPDAHAAMAQAANPFGDGHAAERIVKALVNYSD